MLNRPTSPWSENAFRDGAAWDVDRNPQIRFILLWMGMVLPLFAIVGRAGQLQLNLQDEFANAFSILNVTTEDIPARDGRILSADGVVLATDVQTFDVVIHYPVIQDPPESDWVEARAKPRLNKKDRRDKRKLTDEKTKVMDETNRFWSDLTELTGQRPEEILESRQKVQARVVQIKEDVLRRHRERQLARETDTTPESPSSIWDWGIVLLQMNPTRERSYGPDRIEEELQYHTIISDVSTDVKEEIEAHPKRYPYARVLVHTRRTYPQRELASHLIGHRKPLSVEQLQERKSTYPNGDPQDYRLGDPCGLSGLEREYDSILKGIRGKRKIVKNRRGQIVESLIVNEPQHGRDVSLTLDSEIQHQAEQILTKAMKVVTNPGTVDLESRPGTYRLPTRPQGAAIVALDIHTGAIIAAASAPRFDLNLLVSADQESWEDIETDKQNPLFSRATKMKLPPGSVFKVITAVASIESGKMPPDVAIPCRGYLDDEKHHRCFTFLHQGLGHGDVTLADALCRSCNVYFYTAARRMGPQVIVDWASAFGIGQPTGIDLPTEEPGRLPSPESKRTRWKPGDTLDLAIGQAELQVTPLQMARVMAGIANDGYLVTPHLAANSGPASLDESDSIRKSLGEKEVRPIPGLHSHTLDYVRKGLTMVVHDPHGTAYKTVRMKEVTIAGKTGTAQTSGVDHAWFAGYVPAERPRIAFVVVLEHGGSGGKAAGPVAHDFVKTLIDKSLIDTEKPTKLASDRVRRKR